MPGSPRDTYLEGVDPAFVPLVTTLDELVRAAAPELQPRISYKMLMYVFGKDLRNFVVAIDARPKCVYLRFLHGAELTDPGGVLRAGTSSLSTIDCTALEQVDPAAVTRLVQEAAAGHEQFKAKWAAIRAAKE
ncbi:MAG: DUF1801 domain-containing protein [Dehalococcoidia bacterium]|nr:DUF1801 domain-containing protein [Dehalococcoidia bacterium]